MITLSVFIVIAGFIIGLGAVTIIDLHGFLGRTSSYWTEATTRTHKVTKPLIWIGTLLITIGGILFYSRYAFTKIPLIHSISILCMVLNGFFLTFSVSPFLLHREREGRSAELLPQAWQNKIIVSFIISVILWWGNLFLFVYFLTTQIH